MLVYSIMLSLYDDIPQDYQDTLVKKECTPTMEDIKELLRLVRDKHAHKQQASINNGNITRSRRAKPGGGNQGSHNGGKLYGKSKDGKKYKKPCAHSKAWNKSIKVNNIFLEGKEHCPPAIFNGLEGWEKQELRKASAKHQAATT